MEWLTNLLGFSNNGGGSPFGALGGGTPQAPPSAAAPPAMPPQMPAQPPVPFMNPQTGQPAPTPGSPLGNPAMPGLLGQLMAKQPPNANSGPLMNQAMSMLKPPQMQPVQWMTPWRR